MALGVYCECGRCLPITEDQAGSALTCSCGRRVVVPLIDEFRENPFVLSAPTLEHRVQRLVAKGVLPDKTCCLRCRDIHAQVVNVELECERYTAHTSGGLRFLILPLPGHILWKFWREQERTDIRGRDTDVSTPIALCATCRHQLHSPTRSSHLLLAGLLLAISGALGYSHLVLGIGPAVVVLTLLALLRNLAVRRWQRSLKGLLAEVPAYRQVLARYPQAVVILPRTGINNP